MSVALAYEEGLACPRCRAGLERRASGFDCVACGAGFGFEDDVPNFMVGERFPDEDKADLLAYEERANRACARDWYLPTISSLVGDQPRHEVRVVSVGCGSGVDVEVLSDAGFDAVGFDCGHRNQVWPRRRVTGRLLLARGEHTPFADSWFDIALTGCVFPHVGVVGDTFALAPDGQEKRLALAREMARVVRPGGHLLVSSPNRAFPFDLFHRHDSKRRIPRPTSPTDRFLLSLTDYRKLFVDGAGCRSVAALPITGYWGFVNMDATTTTRVLRAVLRGWFAAVSASQWLRASPLAPWICVHVVR